MIDTVDPQVIPAPRPGAAAAPSGQRVRPRVVIVGAGFGGLAAARALAKAAVDVVVVDRTNHHLFQPLLYQVATAALSPADIAVAIRMRNRRQGRRVPEFSDARPPLSGCGSERRRRRAVQRSRRSVHRQGVAR